MIPRYSYLWDNWVAKNHQLGDDMHAVVRFAKMHLAMHGSWRIILVFVQLSNEKNIGCLVYIDLYYPI